MMKEPDSPLPGSRIEFRRGPADLFKVILVYCVAGPMLFLFAGIMVAVLLTHFVEQPWFPAALVLPAYMIAFVTPLVLGGVGAVGRYRRWSIDRVTVDSDRIEWFRKDRKTTVEFSDLSRLRASTLRLALRSRKGPSLELSHPTWPIYELRNLLEARAVGPMADRMVDCLRSGETVSCSPPTRIAMIYLVGGAIVVGLGLIVGSVYLRGLKVGVPPLVLVVATLGALGAGGELLRRFYRTFGHRIELDGRGIRLFSLPRWRSLPWDRITAVEQDADALKIEGPWPSKPLRLDKEIDNYGVIWNVVERLRVRRDDE